VILYPAIDISDGKAVRLRQGSFDDVTVYEDSPLEAARSWMDAGARFLHVVDLDGARTWSASSASWASPCSTAAACARCPPSATRCGRGPTA
jgi:phosphoribosylformimino-5-aminoimidazole carboxamide ribonucleotide (ProFAR) isomerase